MALKAVAAPLGSPVGGSGTANTIPRWGSGSPSTTLTDSGLIDNGTAIYTTTRDVGIGTASPTASSTIFKANNSLGAWNAQDLSVDGLSNGDAVYQRWYATAVAGAVGRFGISFSAGVASFVWNSLYNAGVTSSELMRLAGGGNLGIGTAGPISPLHVKGNATNTDGILTLTPNTGGRNHQVQSLQASSLFRIYDQSAGASRLEIDINGNISATTTGGTFNASTTNAGIKLPATPGNTDPNTLDCYADGGTANSGGVTWTPSLRFGGNTTGITGSQVGRYTRIGNMVFAQGTVALSSKGSATGSATISGLPTSANVAATIYYSVAIGYNSKVTFTGQLHGLISVNSGIVELYQTSTAGVVSAITNTDFAADSVLTFTVCYPVT